VGGADELNEWYVASLLLTGGICLGFAMHALMLARQSRERAYLCLAILSLLEAAYCIASYGTVREPRPAIALRWAQAFCVFTPFITYVFAELVVDLTRRELPRRRWIRAYQAVNLAATTAFAVQVAIDALAGTSILMGHSLVLDPGTRHRIRIPFTPLGDGWLAWVSLNFAVFAAVLFRGYRTRRHLLPIVVGCVAYFAATISDFAVVTGAFDTYYVQHLGFAMLVAGCYVVLARRYELSLVELSAAVGSLQEQHRRLHVSPQVAHQQRLDGIGMLAAGVAHEINNPVHGIMNYAELLKRQTSDPQAAAFAAEIANECARVASIVNALLSFARSDDKQLGGVTAREVVEDVVRLMRTTIAAQGVHLDLDIDDDIPEIHDGAQRLKQVIMNLLTNACDALHERDPRRGDDKVVRIVARKEEADGAVWLVIEAIDNADGIEPALLDRIFDPFFTTKPPGRGTGLGLAISHELVAGYGGELTCRTARGEGSSFKLKIPVHDGSPHRPSLTGGLEGQ
jgi:signal transduction histidine kinase